MAKDVKNKESDNTTIQIRKSTRRKLKVLSAKNNKRYDEVLNDLIKNYDKNG